MDFPAAQAIFASGGGSGEKKDDVDKAVEALVEGARKYRRKYKRPPGAGPGRRRQVTDVGRLGC